MNDERVSVYWNIRRRVFSVRSEWSGLVIGHTGRILLADAAFVVREAGRLRVLRTGHKNVHAWVTGCPVAYQNSDTGEGSEPLFVWEFPEYTLAGISYNPFENSMFIRKETSETIWDAERVLCEIVYGVTTPRPRVLAYRAEGWST